MAKYLCKHCLSVSINNLSKDNKCSNCGNKLNNRDKLSLTKLKKQTWNIFSKYVRLRDCLESTGSLKLGICFTCGKEIPIESLQAGHMVSGRTNGVLFDEENVKIQCKPCNVFKNGQQGLFVLNRIDELVGAGYSEKEAIDYIKRCFTVKNKEINVEDLLDLYKFYIKKVEEMQNDC